MSILKQFYNVIAGNIFTNYHSDTPGIPSTVMIGTTNRCNLNCLMCGTKNIKGHKGFMGMELFENIISQCAQSKIKNIALHSVGEPLLHKGLTKQINYAKDHNLNVFFSTNGQLLNSKLSNRILSTRLDAIRFSIEGAKKEIYESIRIGGKFDVLMKNLTEFKKKRDAINPKCKIYITSILMKSNIAEIKKFKKLFRPLCDEIYFTYLANPGNQVSEIKNAMYIKKKTRVSPCRLLWNTMVVGYDGKVAVCCLDFNNQLVVGDIMKDRLLTIWHNDIYRYYRRLHQNKRFYQMPLCGGCDKEVNSNFNLFFLNFKSRFFV